MLHKETRSSKRVGARISRGIICDSTYNLPYSDIMQVYSGPLFHNGEYYLLTILSTPFLIVASMNGILFRYPLNLALIVSKPPS